MGQFTFDDMSGTMTLGSGFRGLEDLGFRVQDLGV